MLGWSSIANTPLATLAPEEGSARIGIQSVRFGEGLFGFNRLSHPLGISTESLVNLYISGSASGGISIFQPEGESGSFEFLEPFGAFDHQVSVCSFGLNEKIGYSFGAGFFGNVQYSQNLGVGSIELASLGFGENSAEWYFCPIGENSYLKMPVSYGIHAISALPLHFSESLVNFFALVNDLTAGDPVSGGQSISVQITDEVTSTQKLTAEISGSLSGILTSLQEFAKGNPISGNLSLSSRMIDEITSIQKLAVEVSESLSGILTSSQELAKGDPASGFSTSSQSIIDGAQSVESLITSFSEGLSRIETYSGEISASHAQAISTILSKIEFNNVAQSIATISQIIGGHSDFNPPSITSSWNIYIDGRSVKKYVLDGSVTFSEGAVHNTIDLSFANTDIFDLADPNVHFGQSRIELQIGNRALYFLLEEREGSELNFSVWGRSISALEDEPYAQKSSFYLEEQKMASEVASELAGSRVLDWEVIDWMLPVGFQYTGTPIVGLSEIAKSVGAVLRVQDDGSFLVRSKCPIRPIDSNQAPPKVNYDRFSNIIELGFSESFGEPYDAVPVEGNLPDSPLPDLVVQESSPVQTEDVHVRAFWPGEIIPPVEIYTTDGGYSYVTSDVERFEEEVIIFSDGAAKTQNYVENIVSVEWIGTPGGLIEFEVGSKDLYASSPNPCVAKITYDSAYTEYLFHGHDVETLVVVFSVDPDSDTSIVVKIGLGKNLAPAIESQYITNQAAAIALGTAWLDDNVYDTIELSLSAPYHDQAIDGNLVHIANENIRMTGNAKIIDSSITFSGLKVMNNLKVISWKT